MITVVDFASPPQPPEDNEFACAGTDEPTCEARGRKCKFDKKLKTCFVDCRDFKKKACKGVPGSQCTYKKGKCRPSYADFCGSIESKKQCEAKQTKKRCKWSKKKKGCKHR